MATHAEASEEAKATDREADSHDRSRTRPGIRGCILAILLLFLVIGARQVARNRACEAGLTRGRYVDLDVADQREIVRKCEQEVPRG